ncbi:hydrogenase nickel incorporation protein HypB [Corallincola platygyrae]|uniref:Hydrogenase maturation factor HypB n=1 Tax=Corallincola platygyrae TaxID=1193278 RepID=A0ABW4XLU1_9GAMM
MCDHCGCEQAEAVTDNSSKTEDLNHDLMQANRTAAQHNRNMLERAGVSAINLISSPGAGKTTLLVETLKQLQGRFPTSVVEGDQHTERDANRIRAVGVPAVQIQTGSACHLDAQMVHNALHQLPLEDGGLLFIENVGNLICPAHFELGETAVVALLSVTEGDDKPLKYPHIFHQADLLVITKTDLLPYVDFNVDGCVTYARRLNPDIAVIQLSAKTGAGIEDWLNWLCQLQGD